MSQAPYGPTPATPPPWPPQAAPAPRRASQLLGILGLVLGLLGLGIGTAAWFRAAPKPAATPTYSEQQVAEAKKAVCDGFSQGQDALSVAGSKRSDIPSESFAIALNSRLAVDAVMDHLRSNLLENPAASEAVKTTVRDLANNYQELLLKTVADKTGSDLDPILKKIEASTNAVEQACE